MDEIFGSAGLAAGEQERILAIEKRIGLDAYNDPSHASPSEEKEDIYKA